MAELDRRSVLIGAAWTAPVIAFSVGAPAFASSRRAGPTLLAVPIDGSDPLQLMITAYSGDGSEAPLPLELRFDSSDRNGGWSYYGTGTLTEQGGSPSLTFGARSAYRSGDFLASAIIDGIHTESITPSI